MSMYEQSIKMFVAALVAYFGQAEVATWRFEVYRLLLKVSYYCNHISFYVRVSKTIMWMFAIRMGVP